MQVSTRNTDYIVDTLQLRDKMSVLNEIFTDPAVVKVNVLQVNFKQLLFNYKFVFRYFMEQIVIFLGYREILVYMLLICLTHIKPLKF